MTRTEQFLSDLEEVRKGLPRYLKSIANQGNDLWYLMEHHPAQAERIYAHQLGRGTHLNDTDFTLVATGRTHPQTRKPVMSLGEAARAESRVVPAGSNVSGFGRKVAAPIGVGQMTPAQRQNYVRMNTRRINDYRSRMLRNNPPAASAPANRVYPVTTTPAAAPPHVAANQPAAVVPGPGPSQHVHQTTPAPPSHPVNHAPMPPVQHAQPPVQVTHGQGPSTSPVQQVPPARREDSRRNKWLRRSIGASLGLGAAGGGTYVGYRNYQNQMRNQPRVRNQWSV